ncbi:MAG: pyrroline-5-carboxylate reductase [Solidesulfovibrio sp.]|uniref:pyrroline-5-carboxylate reductase n=1 Tax=Solidesulfovibrio sp. TaxID=2910990 RepID=UPI002B21AE63|nr:pyrroline-5-carboxylate reductase [Solidesulfovibrio sp.]MEA4856564.1 pyrroline-5-carboxylate reductase [Solidesulfovibrio sp.]
MAAVIGFLGAGNMGAAIIKGLADVAAVSALAFDLDTAKVDALAGAGLAQKAPTPQALAAGSDYLVLCVKPQYLAAAMETLAPHLKAGTVVCSIVAGVTMARLRELTGGKCPVVRVMPNTPALVGAGQFALCLDDPDLPAEAKAFVEELFAKLGRTYVLHEKFFDAFTGLAGSGPAYVLYFMEALIESGVYMGFPRDKAADIVTGLFAGTAKLAAKSGNHPSLLREMVTSPAGTTIEALMHLDRQAVRAAIIDAAVASRDRSKKLGG